MHHGEHAAEFDLARRVEPSGLDTLQFEAAGTLGNDLGHPGTGLGQPAQAGGLERRRVALDERGQSMARRRKPTIDRAVSTTRKTTVISRHTHTGMCPTPGASAARMPSLT